jgi:hypothetical protein
VTGQPGPAPATTRWSAAQYLILETLAARSILGERRGTTWDHIWPRSRGGISHPANVVPACSTCNSSKKANDPAPWVDRGIRAHRDPWLHLIDLAMETGQDEWVEAWQEAAA